jgi:streptomycin 6-kinase
MTGKFTDSIPSELVSHVTVGCGDRGVRWLAELSSTIKELETQWSLTVNDPFPGIEYNFVAPATTHDGADVVVKIAPPWDPVEILGEGAYLRDRDGVRCARLLEESSEHRALLIERIFPGKTLTEHFAGREPEAVVPAIEVLQAVLKPVPQGIEHITPVDHWFDRFRQRYASADFPAHYAGKALEIYDRLSADPKRIFYLHGDYHPGNVVTAGDSFCVIDPKGWAGHVGYEIAVFLNNFHWWQEKKPDIRELLATAVDLFAEAFDLDPFEIREWAYAQMVIGAWWNFNDMPELYDGSVAKADIWDV